MRVPDNNGRRFSANAGRRQQGIALRPQRRQCRLGHRVAEQRSLRIQRLNGGFELLKFERHGRLKCDR